MGWQDLIFPKRCAGCGKWGRYVCGQCEIGMSEAEGACPGCGGYSHFGLAHKKCAKKAVLAGLVVFWEYEGVVKQMVEGIKYEGWFDMTGELVELGVRMWGEERFEKWREFVGRGPVLAPVPLHKRRERERGFNQAKILAQKLSKTVKLEVKDLLERVKDTGQQVGRSREERLKAMAGAFRANYKLEKGMEVVVLDDVWTTGATMRECARALKAAGAGEVWGLALAR